jgi:hypothetical protein
LNVKRHWHLASSSYGLPAKVIQNMAKRHNLCLVVALGAPNLGDHANCGVIEVELRRALFVVLALLAN